MTRPIELTDDDRAQVHAILMTHAQISDQQSVNSMELIGRLRRDEPVAAAETISDLEGQVKTFDADYDNLSRIARLFE